MTNNKNNKLDDNIVLDYLKSNPDFWEKNSSQLMLEHDEEEDGVLDLQQFILKKMRDNSVKDQIEKKALIDLGKANFITFRRMQDCILTSLASESMEQLIDVIYRDWAILLELDMIVIAIETDNKDDFPVKGVSLLNDGDVDKYLGENDIYIESNGTSKDIFGSRSVLINSYALVRLPLGEDKPNALVGFGVSQPGIFDYSHGTESIAFLCSALGYIVRRWLVLP
ncbi:MAG: DUF484 family protein [Alphaproteobacteria bacterium]